MGPTAELERAMKTFARLMQLNRIPYTITSVYRDPVKQRKLYDAWIARGRTGLPVARPGCSTHEYGLAVDMLPRSGSPVDFQIMRILAGLSGLHWFGPGDRVHFDLVGRSWPAIVRASGRC